MPILKFLNAGCERLRKEMSLFVDIFFSALDKPFEVCETCKHSEGCKAKEICEEIAAADNKDTIMKNRGG
jgi:hypothetical protein